MHPSVKQIFDDVAKSGWHVVAIPEGSADEPEYVVTAGSNFGSWISLGCGDAANEARRPANVVRNC